MAGLNLFVLKATLGLDTKEYDEGIKQSADKANTFADVLKANLVTKGIEVAVRGMAKLGRAAVNVVSQSVDAFADYEQLVGGVETLFKDSADTVKQYAQDAYINAGLSANEYMETVTSFSASLIQSLGGDTKQAAELANLAIEDMSDNANKMGTDMSAIQNAYQGFAKQNYTMLDNLKLGYGGTKQEMDRLIKDAMKLNKNFKVATKTTKNGKKANKELAYSYADIVKAIHIVQEEMDITGTTAKEAEHTIAGSLNMVKAAWKNLLAGLGEGDDGKIDMLVEQLVYSAEKYLNNMLPVVENILYGLVTLLENLAPVIADRLPGFIQRILPSLTKATATLITAFAKALIANAPTLISAGLEVAKAVLSAISEEAPALIPILFGVVGVKAAGTIQGIVDALGKLAAHFGLVNTAATEAAAATEGAAAAMGSATTAGSTLTTILGGVATAALAVADALLLAYDFKALNDAWRGYKEAGDAHKQEIQDATDTYRRLLKEQGMEVADKWAEVVYGIDTSTDNVAVKLQRIKQEINEEWEDVPQNLWDGFKAGWNDYFGQNGKGLLSLLGDAFNGAVNGVKNILGIHSPSTVMEGIGTNMMQGLENGISAAQSLVLKAIDSIVDAITQAINNPVQFAADWGRDLIGNFLNGISSMWEKAKGMVSNFASMIRSYLGFSEPEEGPLSNFHTYAPDMVKLFAQGIEDNKGLVANAISDVFTLPRAAGVTTGGAGQEFTVPNGNGGGQDLTIIVKLSDETELARAVYRMYNNESNRRGVRLAGVM